MPEVILPCPACGSKSIEIDWDNGVHFMKCERCGVSGPCFNDEYPREFVADAWNALPRSLRWTHEPPKVAGWYWFSIGKGHAVCLLVCADGKAKLAKDHFTDADMLGGEWAGPIAPPVEG